VSAVGILSLILSSFTVAALALHSHYYGATSRSCLYSFVDFPSSMLSTVEHKTWTLIFSIGYLTLFLFPTLLILQLLCFHLYLGPDPPLPTHPLPLPLSSFCSSSAVWNGITTYQYLLSKYSLLRLTSSSSNQQSWGLCSQQSVPSSPYTPSSSPSQSQSHSPMPPSPLSHSILPMPKLSSSDPEAEEID
jgi:hypothetical protein